MQLATKPEAGSRGVFGAGSAAAAVTNRAARALGFWRAGGVVSLLALVAAFGLKFAYSRAGASELEWVLGPSCWLAQLAGMSLEYERGAGWISHSARMVVGPACAGVNFLVVSWLALYFCQQRRCSGGRRKLLWLLASGAIAYLATIGTNGARIVLAAELYGRAIAAGWLTPERLHRLLGVVLYCTVLLGLCSAAERVLSPLRAAGSRLAPFAWYLAVVLGIPLLNRSFADHPERFAEHAAFTLGAGLCVVLLFWGLGQRRHE